MVELATMFVRMCVSLLMLVAATCSADIPAHRWGHVFVYDQARDEIVLFGGANERGSYLEDTWTWKNGTWMHHATTAGPTARGFVGAAFDRSTNRVIIHGGRGDNRVTHSDTWAWDGQSWVQLEAENSWQVDHHQVVWDKARAQLVGFGGWTGSQVTNETRLWVNNTWVVVTVENPPPRSSFGMAFDASQNQVVVYGGLWINGQYADTWRWNGSQWAAYTGPYDNSSIDHHSIVWDAERNELVLFGGKNYRYVPNDMTRLLVDKVWVDKSEEGPSPRHSSPLTWHEGRRTVVLFGGKQDQQDQQLPLGDLWEWDGKSWRTLE
jgi:hypothetical protein